MPSVTITDITSRVHCTNGTAGPRCQTGEPYLVMRSCGREVEGEACGSPTFFDTGGEALASLCRHIVAHIDQHAGPASVLYWRTEPELEYTVPILPTPWRGQAGHPGGWRARARFCLSR